MNIIKIIKATEEEPQGYTMRPTAKGVIFNAVGEVAIYDGLLPGGGVENNETFEEALKRECIEEIGHAIENINELGTVIQYRDLSKRKYEVHGYMADVVGDAVVPTTTQESEIGRTFTWVTLDEAIHTLEQEIGDLQKADQTLYPGDTYQAKLYNRQTAVFLLRETKKYIQ